MKNIIKILFLLLLISAVGCNNEDELCVKRSVTLYASDAATRTSFTYDEAADKYKTLWVEDDAMQVILAADGANTYDYTFQVQDVATGKFTCDDVYDNSAIYNAYGVYPASAAVSRVNRTATVQIGHDILQSQVGENPNHIAAFDPMWGNQENVALDDIYLQMHHTASVMQFSILNQTGKTVKVKSVEICAPNKVISGKRILNLQDGTLSAVDENPNKDSSDIQLNISEMTIVNDDVAKAWVAMLPFTVEAGDEIVFVVTTSDEDGNNEKRYAFTKTFGGEVEFPSGKVMEMYAPIVLSESNLVKEVTVDFTAGSASYPPEFPKTKTMFSGSDPKAYTLDGQSFKLFTTQYYWSGTKGDKLRFVFNGESGTSKPSADDYALLYLPEMENMKIFNVDVALDSDIKQSSIVQLAIVNPNTRDSAHGNSNGCGDTSFEFTEIVKMGAKPDQECCLYLHFNGVSKLAKDCNCYITGITIDYIPQ